MGFPPWARRHLTSAVLVAAGSSPVFGAANLPLPPVTAALPALVHEGWLLPTGDPLGDRYDSFGASAAADGDTLAVGVPGHDLPASDAGCVFVYEQSGGSWSQTAKLPNPEAGTALRFGSRVALDGDTLAVATERSWGASRVYVFVRQAGDWSLQAALPPPAQAYGFAAALSLSGDSLAVGAPDADTGFGSRSGAAYVYTRLAGTWALEQEVLGLEIAADDNFGAAVALDADRLAVGAPGDDPGTGLDAGSVYVYERTAGSWSQVVKLVDPAGGAWFRFGRAVALAAGTLAVGAPGQGDGRVHVYEEIAGVWIPRALLASTSSGQGRFGDALALGAGEMLVGFEPSGTGAAEIFAGSGGSWTPGTPLVASGLEAGDFYGAAVGLTPGTAVVGAPDRLETGAVWVWTGSGASWTIQARIDNAGTPSGDGFGSASALEDTTLVVGAPDDDTVAGRDSGAVYIFERVGPAWELRQKLLPPPGMSPSPWDGPLFGTSVALSGDRLAVGAPRAHQQGRVLVFTRAAGAWSLAAELAQSDPSSYAEFGAAVALRGTRLLVGAPQAEAGWRSGAVYAFEEVGGTWLFRQKVVSAGTSSGLGATLAVSLSGTIAVAGAPVSGSASLLALSAGTWSEAQRLVPPTPDSPGDFGRAVALTETEAFVGAPSWAEAPYSPAVGAVHVFRSSGGTWAAEQVLKPATDDYGRRFGSAMAVDGARLAVGAPGYYQEGAVHLFEAVAGSWTPATLLEGSGVGLGPGFGASVAVHSGRVVVGDPGADSPAGSSSGTVDVFGPSASDLAVAIAGPASTEQGALVTAGVQLTNSGPAPVVGAAVRASVGAGIVVDGWSLASGSCSGSGPVVTCALPAVPVGTSLVAEIRVAAVVVGTWPIVVEMATSDLDPANDVATLDLAVSPSVADVSLSAIAGRTYARVGEPLDYTLLLSNAGPGAAAGLEIGWTSPPGLILESVVGCDPADCGMARMGAEVKSLQVRYQVPADYGGPVPILFAASVTTLSQDPQPGDNQASVATHFVPPPAPLGYYTVTPCRLYDSRVPGQLPLAAGEVRVVSPSGATCGIGWGARALALNVTVTGATAPGNVRVYPAYSPVPNVSTVNYAAGQTRAGNVVIGLSPEGDLAVRASQASGTVHVVLDVVGYFE